MAFNVRASSLDPTKMADAWGAGVGRSGQKLADGYASPRRDPRAAAVAAAPAWLANTTAAAGRYKDKVGSYDADAAIQSMRTNGAGRYSAAGTSKKQNFAKKAPGLIAAIQSVLQSLPTDTSTHEGRKARMIAMTDGMHSKKGTF